MTMTIIMNMINWPYFYIETSSKLTITRRSWYFHQPFDRGRYLSELKPNRALSTFIRVQLQTELFQHLSVELKPNRLRWATPLFWSTLTRAACNWCTAKARLQMSNWFLFSILSCWKDEERRGIRGFFLSWLSFVPRGIFLVINKRRMDGQVIAPKNLSGW